MLDDEVRVDEIEAVVVEGQRVVEIGGKELVQVRVRAACLLVGVDAHQPLDAVAVVAKPRRPATTRVEDHGPGPECVVEQASLDQRVVGVHWAGRRPL